MKRFLISCFLFVLLIGATLLLGECFIRTLPNPYKYKHQWMLDNGKEVEVLFLGSSHIYYGIKPSLLSQKAFNLANIAQNLRYDYVLLNQYADRYKNLQTVIVSLSYFSFFSKELEDTRNWWFAINYKLYMDVNIHSDFSKYNCEVLHFGVYRGKIASFLFGNNHLTYDTLGHGNNYDSHKKPKTWQGTTAVAAVNRHTAKDWEAVDENITHLRKIISFCQSRGVSVVLITPPTWHSYYEKLDEKQLNKMYTILHEIQKEYHLPYYDYLKDTRFIADDFYDSDHLSETGAEKFTEILQKEVKGRGERR